MDLKQKKTAGHKIQKSRLTLELRESTEDHMRKIHSSYGVEYCQQFGANFWASWNICPENEGKILH